VDGGAREERGGAAFDPIPMTGGVERGKEVTALTGWHVKDGLIQMGWGDNETLRGAEGGPLGTR
jgi:hypothetical protein